MSSSIIRTRTVCQCRDTVVHCMFLKVEYTYSTRLLSYGDTLLLRTKVLSEISIRVALQRCTSVLPEVQRTIDY